MMSRENDGPVFVVGQPRSGSTLITRLLNDSPDLFVINDFYGLQKIDAENLWGPLSAGQAQRVAHIVFERVEIRATQEAGKTLEQSIDLSPEHVEALRAFARQPWKEGVRWHQILAAVLGEATRLAGAKTWGYNTPQDYLHLERLFDAFPNARVIFLLRQPEAVLKSYKNVSGPWHDPARYNPVAIGMAWRAASRAFDIWAAKKPGQVLFLTYEQLTRDTDRTVAEIAGFLDAPFTMVDIGAFGRNTSHDGASPKKLVTPSEVWLCYRMIGDELRKRGFTKAEPGCLRVRDVPTLSVLAFRSARFILKSVATDSDRRRRIMKLVVNQS